jgi:hypothetical protein
MMKLTGAFYNYVHIHKHLKMDLKERRWKYMDWMCQAHNKKNCQALVNTVNPVTSALWEISSLGKKLIAFQAFSSMELVSRALSSGM